MKLECDCGHVASGTDGEGLVIAAQTHAWKAHRVDLAAETILAIAASRSEPHNSPDRVTRRASAS